MERQFTWLEVDSYANGSVLLEQGKTYKVADFGEDVVSWWVKSKVAKYVGTETKKEKEKGD